MKGKRNLLIFILILMGVFISSCFSKKAKVSKIIVQNGSEIQIEYGEEINLVVLYEYEDGKKKTANNISITIKDLNVVELSNNTLKSKSIGETLVTIKGEGKSTIISVKVIKKIKNIEIIIPDKIYVGEKIDRVAKVNISYSEGLDGDQKVEWTSNDTDILKIDSNGKMTGLKKGTTIIRAEKESIISEKEIEIVEVVDIDFENIPEIENGSSYKINYQVEYSDGTTTTTTSTLTWKIADKSIAKVVGGIVTGLSVGETKMTASILNFTKTVDIRIKYPELREIVLAKDQINLDVNKSYAIDYSLVPENSKSKLTFTSKNSLIAIVDSEGEITALREGETQITITSDNGVKSTLNLKVNKEKVPLMDLKIENGNFEIEQGKTKLITVEFIPENTSETNINFVSNDENILKINSSGLLEAITPGIAKITVNGANGINDVIIVTVVKEVILVESVEIANGDLELTEGDTKALNIDYLPENSTNIDFIFSSSDPLVAGVTTRGVVTAKKEGETKITVSTSSGIKDEITLKVNKLILFPNSIKINERNLIIKEGEKIELSYTFEPEKTTERDVVWSSKDSEIVSISKTGIITGIKEGSTEIDIITENKKSDTIVVTVKTDTVSVISVNIIDESLELKQGSKKVLDVEIKPSDATDKTIYWISDNSDIVSVDENGEVTAKKYGSATIAAISNNGKKDEILIKVEVEEVLATKIEIIENDLELQEGDKVFLTYKITPNDTTNKSVSWKSSNENTVIVSKTGELEALSAGISTISVITSNNKIDQISVKVTEKIVAVESVEVVEEKVNLKIGDEYTLNVKVLPEDASDKSLVYNIDTLNIATIDLNGKIKAIANGKGTITIKSKNGKTDTVSLEINNNYISVGSIGINSEDLKIKIDEEVDLEYTLLPVNATDKNIEWSSNDDSIVSVTKEGKIKGLKIGKTQVMISGADDKSDTIQIEVIEEYIEVNSVKIESEDLTIKIDDQINLTYTLLPVNASNKNIVWSSVDESIVSVTNEGKIQGLKIGKTQVMISGADDKSDTIQIEVIEEYIEVNSVKIESEDLTIKIDDQINLTYTLLPQDASNKNVIWSSSDKEILTIDENGKIIGISEGEVIVSLNASDKKVDTIKVIVEKKGSSKGLGENHPESGDYSVIDEENWGNESFELGSNFGSNNLTFALYSKNAERILLEIYEESDGEDAKYDYWMKKGSDNIWRANIECSDKFVYYAFRVWGPNWKFDEKWIRGNSNAGFIIDVDVKGNRMNPNKVVYDPYAKEISHDRDNPDVLGTQNGGMYASGDGDYFGTVRREFDSGKWAPKGIAFKPTTTMFSKPKLPMKDAIIYEAHVRGISQHPSSTDLSSILNGIEGFEEVESVPDHLRGTYAGAAYIAKYLKAAGFTTIELLPIHETNNDHNPPDGPGGNYWGYMTYGFFAPDRRYSYDKSPGGPTKEFKEMVKAFHNEGLEVYLDVVYNHTGEGGTWGAAFETAELTSFKGIDNSEYYHLVKVAGRESEGLISYQNNSGTGNNFYCGHEPGRKMILDSLTYWIDEMGVDGFRYDLAEVLGREGDYPQTGGEYKTYTEENGTKHEWYEAFWFQGTSQTLKDIADLGVSRDVEMVAEAWAVGGYAVGGFPEDWCEWTDKYRQAVRKFTVGEGVGGFLKWVMSATPEGDNSIGWKGPEKSVNYIAAHDGFTLMDIVSYNKKLNWVTYDDDFNIIAGEPAWPFGPSDGGSANNVSDSGGDRAIRRQKLRNFWVIYNFSMGTPMSVWGDEVARTQNGNSNPYNIDSIATWTNYNMINTDSPTAVATGGDGIYHDNFGTDLFENGVNNVFEFSTYVRRLRQKHEALRRDNYDVSYHFSKADGSDLADDDRAIKIHIDGSSIGDTDFIVMMNHWVEPVNFTYPKAESGKKWIRIIDTSSWAEGAANNYWDTDNAAILTDSAYGVNPWSIVVLQEVE